ncbi:unnamed protein product, partial [Nesidiocoris tenuis]
MLVRWHTVVKVLKGCGMSHSITDERRSAGRGGTFLRGPPSNMLGFDFSGNLFFVFV